MNLSMSRVDKILSLSLGPKSPYATDESHGGGFVSAKDLLHALQSVDAKGRTSKKIFLRLDV